MTRDQLSKIITPGCIGDPFLSSTMFDKKVRKFESLFREVVSADDEKFTCTLNAVGDGNWKQIEIPYRDIDTEEELIDVIVSTIRFLK